MSGDDRTLQEMDAKLADMEIAWKAIEDQQSRLSRLLESLRQHWATNNPSENGAEELLKAWNELLQTGGGV